MRFIRPVLGILLFLSVVVSLSASPLALASGQVLDRPETGDPVTDALRWMNWRSIGPANMSGRVSAIVGIPGDRNTWWFGGADGGVWKTTNGGVTFEGQWQDAEAYSVGALAVAASDTNVVWLGSGEGDPRNSVSYRPRRVALHRRRRQLDPPRPRRHRAHKAHRCASPRSGHGAGMRPGPRVGVPTRSAASSRLPTAAGAGTKCSTSIKTPAAPTWTWTGATRATCTPACGTFRRRPWRFDDSGGKETALYVSRDLGETWKKIETTPDEPMARPGVAVAQSSPNVVYIVTEYPTAGTLLRSDDYGETWTMVNDDRGINFRPFYYSDVFVDPSDENTVFVISGGQSKSTDGGRTFQRIASGVHGDHQSLWIDPADGDYVLSGSDGGYQVSYDGGINYHIWRNVALSQFYQIFFDDRDPYWVCGGLQDNGNWCGPSRSKAGSILNDDWYTVSGGDGFYTVPVPGKPNLVYSNAQGGYFTITDTNTGRARSIPPYPRMIGSQGQGMFQARYRFNWDAPIHISPHDPNVTYWGGNVLFRSADEYYTFDVISPGPLERRTREAARFRR